MIVFDAFIYLLFIAMNSRVIQLELKLSNGRSMYGSNPRRRVTWMNSTSLKLQKVGIVGSNFRIKSMWAGFRDPRIVVGYLLYFWTSFIVLRTASSLCASLISIWITCSYGIVLNISSSLEKDFWSVSFRLYLIVPSEKQIGIYFLKFGRSLKFVSFTFWYGLNLPLKSQILSNVSSWQTIISLSFVILTSDSMTSIPLSTQN